MYPQKSLFSSCFPAGHSIGAYLTVETMVEFISNKSHHKLPVSWRKNWVIISFPPTSQDLSLSWLALEERRMSCVLHHSPCVPNWQVGSASLRCTPGDIVFGLLGFPGFPLKCSHPGILWLLIHPGYITLLNILWGRTKYTINKPKICLLKYLDQRT